MDKEDVRSHQLVQYREKEEGKEKGREEEGSDTQWEGRRERKREGRERERIQQKKDIPLIDGWVKGRIDCNCRSPMVSGLTYKRMPSS